MREEILALGELLQSVIVDDDVADVVDVLAQTARASADGEPDPAKRQRLRWYAAQLMKLRAGPPDAQRGPRLTGAAAVQRTLERLMLRINKMRDIEALPLADRVWLETLGDALGHLVAKLPERP